MHLSLKKWLSLILCVLCGIAFAGCTDSAPAADIQTNPEEGPAAETSYTITEPFIPEIDVDSEEWKSLSVQERKEQCNLDRETCEKMDTMALFLTVQKYPFILDIYALADPADIRTAVDKVRTEYNPLDVLLEREDAKEIFESYETPEGDTDWAAYFLKYLKSVESN